MGRIRDDSTFAAGAEKLYMPNEVHMVNRAPISEAEDFDTICKLFVTAVTAPPLEGCVVWSQLIADVISNSDHMALDTDTPAGVQTLHYNGHRRQIYGVVCTIRPDM